MLGTVAFEVAQPGPPADLDEATRPVTEFDRRLVALQGDVRDGTSLPRALDTAAGSLGPDPRRNSGRCF
jgi:hypothetical protein